MDCRVGAPKIGVDGRNSEGTGRIGCMGALALVVARGRGEESCLCARVRANVVSST